jgi:hypothetical protein
MQARQQPVHICAAAFAPRLQLARLQGAEEQRDDAASHVLHSAGRVSMSSTAAFINCHSTSTSQTVSHQSKRHSSSTHTQHMEMEHS